MQVTKLRFRVGTGPSLCLSGSFNLRRNCREAVITLKLLKVGNQGVRIVFTAEEKEAKDTEQRGGILGTEALSCKYFQKLIEEDA